MKHLIILLIILSLSGIIGAENPDLPKALNYTEQLAGSLRMRMSNYGLLSNIRVMPSGQTLASSAGMWVSARVNRRDAEGNLLYWLAQNPGPDSSAVITAADPLWHPGMTVVIDTLTSVSYDSDGDLYELLPAHNPLSFQNPFYAAYNAQDKVLRSILGYPAPRDFSYPDPLGTYCFSIPQDESFVTPGMETLSAWYYDFCPFGTQGERDLGAGRMSSYHYPLGLAVQQRGYAWNLQNHHQFTIVERTLLNTSALDTLYDLCVAEFVEADLQLPGHSTDGGRDDVCGYVRGTGHEFAYARDADHDGGASPYYLAHKLIVPFAVSNHSAWFWKIGDAPNDSNPRSFTYQPRRTRNEKYWLMTGITADDTKFLPLRPPSANLPQYEYPTPWDIRFLNSVSGVQPTAANPDPAGRVNLAPGAAVTIYSIYFTGTDIDELKARSEFLEDFIAGGMQLGDISGLTCIPLLQPITLQDPQTLDLSWHSYTDPAWFEVLYKLFDAPASAWISQQLPGDAREYLLQIPLSDAWYQVKVAAVYNPGPNEVYLESDTQVLNPGMLVDVNSPTLPSGYVLHTYPNPFNPSTTISYDLPLAGRVALSIFNTRGQLVRKLLDAPQTAGNHRITWNGTDARGNALGSGMYILKLEHGGKLQTRRMMLIK